MPLLLNEIRAGNLSAIKQLISKNQDIDAISEPGYTLLCGAVKTNKGEIAKYLIEQGAALDKMSHQKTPLMYAAKYGRLAIAQLLFEKGADKNPLSPKGKSTLDYAIQKERTELVELLKE